MTLRPPTPVPDDPRLTGHESVYSNGGYVKPPSPDHTPAAPNGTGGRLTPDGGR